MRKKGPIYRGGRIEEGWSIPRVFPKKVGLSTDFTGLSTGNYVFLDGSIEALSCEAMTIGFGMDGEKRKALHSSRSASV
jgi:hypothetical protein